MLLNDSCFLSASIKQSSGGLKWNHLVRHTKSTNGKIDGLTKWFESSMLNVVIPRDLHRIWNLRAIKLKSLKAGMVIFKLCWLHFNKLSRSTDYCPLIFDEPLTRMDVNQFKLLLKVICNTSTCTADFICTMPATCVERIPEDPESHYMMINIIFIRISQTLWEYYDSLMSLLMTRADGKIGGSWQISNWITNLIT
ncbi:hypothetical protein MJO28_006395 [Puccinia striiformis f. sp. tritici]|uniref:Uncharacterized protein n=1 Tax=Puccinia striiformis f. sp. tritici TaxID=168172 RepID=A0ACC0EJ49_9BASI|nr:hypothetical protein MJO28_006395 [Puccinia striiformis f. sp. tritici]